MLRLREEWNHLFDKPPCWQGDYLTLASKHPGQVKWITCEQIYLYIYIYIYIYLQGTQAKLLE